MQVYAVLRIAQKNHLLPFDLSQSVILDNDHLNGQLVFDRGHELRHQHGEAAVTDKCDTLPVRVGDLRCDCVR